MNVSTFFSGPKEKDDFPFGMSVLIDTFNAFNFQAENQWARSIFNFNSKFTLESVFEQRK